MDSLDSVRLRREEAASYERRGAAPILFRRAAQPLGAVVGDPALAGRWGAIQEGFMRRVRDGAMFEAREVARTRAVYEAFFRARGPLAGRVLDIGGGWGLFRDWWREDPAALFVVHDPGVERMLAEPPAAVRAHYADGLRKPAWFVEGFGESLPYEDGSYDVVLIASALDHCAAPARVLAEAHRVLRPQGTLIVLQHVDAAPGERTAGLLRLARRLGRLLVDPRHLRRVARRVLSGGGDSHTEHFTRARLQAMFAAAGFAEASETCIDGVYGVFVFEARKPG